MPKKLPADFPKTDADWESVIANAPGEDRPLTPQEEAAWGNAIVSRSLQDLRQQLALRRVRGPGKRPARAVTTLRLPEETLARWRSSGKGWQTRAAAVLTANAPG
jgi:uncharacterized protein (DUF4415 family)